MRGRGLSVHVGLLVVASAAAVYVWTRNPAATAAVAAEENLWPGRSEDVARIGYDAPGKKISLEARHDPHGRWFFGTSDTKAAPPGDAGAPPIPKHAIFASVTEGKKTADALAPFKTTREIGRIDAAREAEFGFKDPPSVVSVVVGGQEHRIAMGGPSPGGFRYVRDEATGKVYAARGNFAWDLESGETSLSEREVHDFLDGDLTSIRVTAGGKTREVLRGGPSTKRIWADPASADKADETVTNWVTKVERLRPIDYVEAPPPGQEPVVRIDYQVKGAQGPVFLEVVKTPGANGKAEYFVRTEHTRLWAKVFESYAQQVEQDLGSVLASK